jgi:hypothetical protein
MDWLESLGGDGVACSDVHLSLALSRRFTPSHPEACRASDAGCPVQRHGAGGLTGIAVLPGCMNSFCRPYVGRLVRVLRFGLLGLLLARRMVGRSLMQRWDGVAAPPRSQDVQWCCSCVRSICGSRSKVGFPMDLISAVDGVRL